MVCALKRRREIDKLGRESVIGIMVLSLVGPKDQKPQKNKYYRKFRVTLMLHHRVRTQRVSTQRVSTQRVSTQRVSTQRVSTQRVSTQRVSAQRGSTQRVSTQTVSTQIVSTLKKNNSNQKSKLRKNK